jgi:predicted DNA binding protein
MSIFGEFRVPPSALALSETFAAEPETVVDIDQDVASNKDHLCPYFAVSGVSHTPFETAARTDASVDSLQSVHESKKGRIYRAQWRDRVETLVHEYTRDGASILNARGDVSGWLLRMRFDAHTQISTFTTALRDHDFSFELVRLHEMTYTKAGSRFGLTTKQQEALITAWEMGFFDLPRDVSMADVAEELGISAQSFSDRLRRAQHTLIADALGVTQSRT